MHIGPPARAPEPRYITIEGRRVRVEERTPPLPQRLDQLLDAMYGVTHREDIRPTGATTACTRDNDHPFRPLQIGRYLGPDRVLRDLRVEMCPHCGACAVRDVTRDRIAGLPTGRLPLGRRDHLLGWYTGARPRQRQYR